MSPLWLLTSVIHLFHIIFNSESKRTGCCHDEVMDECRQKQKGLPPQTQASQQRDSEIAHLFSAPQGCMEPWASSLKLCKSGPVAQGPIIPAMERQEQSQPGCHVTFSKESMGKGGGSRLYIGVIYVLPALTVSIHKFLEKQFKINLHNNSVSQNLK